MAKVYDTLHRRGVVAAAYSYPWLRAPDVHDSKGGKDILFVSHFLKHTPKHISIVHELSLKSQVAARDLSSV